MTSLVDRQLDFYTETQEIEHMKCTVATCKKPALDDFVVCRAHEDENQDVVKLIEKNECPLCVAQGKKTPVKVVSKTAVGYSFRCPTHGAASRRADNRRTSYSKGQLVQMEKAGEVA